MSSKYQLGLEVCIFSDSYLVGDIYERKMRLAQRDKSRWIKRFLVSFDKGGHRREERNLLINELISSTSLASNERCCERKPRIFIDDLERFSVLKRWRRKRKIFTPKAFFLSIVIEKIAEYLVERWRRKENGANYAIINS